MNNEATFPSTPAALLFAFNFSMQQYDRPMMNRMADGPRGHGGLSGLDGAGQAGLVRARLAKLDALHQAALVARYAPPTLPCECSHPCCSGQRPNSEWHAAMRLLADDAEKKALAGCSTRRPLTLGLVGRAVGRNKTAMETLAKQAGVAQNTATNHMSRIQQWYRGERQGKGGDEPKLGIEQIAMAHADDALQGAGLVRSE